MSVRSVRYLLATAVLIASLGLATPAAAHSSGQPTAASVTTINPERIGAMVAALSGLIGIIVGGLALARSTGRISTGNGRLATIVTLAAGPTDNQRRGATAALVLGLFAIALGGLIAATSNGSFGTGNGLGGAVFAMVLALIGITLGGLTMARIRHSG